MKLSVCIFTYNHNAYIGKAIESALTQVTDFEFEIVVGEDCSTDGTREIVEYYQRKFPKKIKAFFNQSNLGMMRNNAYTISCCNGEYIALLDGDDYWINDNKLQKQVDFLEANQNYSLCFHDGRILKSNNQWDKKTCCGPRQKATSSFTDVICDTHIPTFSIVFRKKALVGYPPRWFTTLNAPDRPLFLMLVSSGLGYYFNECWGVYRKHLNGSWTGQNYVSQGETHLQIYEAVNEHFSKKYNKSFCRCESRITYTLSVRLIKDNKVKKSIYYFQKYLRINSSILSTRPAVYFRILFFLFLYLKTKLFFKS